MIFQLSAAPAAITGVSQSPANPTSSDPVIVTATTDVAPPAEQALWLRYAVNNNWPGSTVVKMTGSGTSYGATIPAQVDGTQVSYYIFSSGNVAAIAGSDADLMTITYNTNGGSNYSYTVASAPGPLTVTGARAMWLDADTIAWNAAAGASYKLLYDADGGMTDAAEGAACVFPSPSGPCYVTLTASGTISGYAKNPNATGLIRLTTGLSADNAKHLLKGQVVAASYDSGGARLAATRAQIQSVLDALYAANAKTQTLGVTYSGGTPTVKVWAPTAKSVTLKRYATSAGAEAGSHAMTLDAASGVWSVTGDAGWNRQFYLFDVEVYVYAASPAVDAVVHNLVSDPYAISLSQDGAAAGDVRSQFVNLADSDLKPAGWDSLAKPALTNFEDIVGLRSACARLQRQRRHGCCGRPGPLQGVHLRRRRAARQHDAVGRHEPLAAAPAGRPDPRAPAAGVRHRIGDRACGPAHRAGHPGCGARFRPAAGRGGRGQGHG